MIRRKEVANYLKYAISKELSYNDPVEVDSSLPFDDCVQRYREIYEKALFSIDTDGKICALTGGLDSTLNAFYLRDKVDYFCYPIEGNNDSNYAERLADEWGLNLFSLDKIDINEFENILFSMNKFWEKPRCITDDFHIYDMFVKINNRPFISGWGSNISCLGFTHIYGPIIELAMMRKEYDALLAKSVFDERCSVSDRNFDVNRAITNRYYSYSDLLSTKGLLPIVVFSDEQIEGFGLEPPTVKLKEETLPHVLQATFDWFIYSTANGFDLLLEKFGLNSFTPYEDELRDFCLTVPYEYRFCLGVDRYIQRKFMLDVGYPYDLLQRKKEAPQSNSIWWDAYYKYVIPLMDKHLDKKNFIFELIDYDYFQKEFENFTYYQKWVLLNLSIWFNGRLHV